MNVYYTNGKNSEEGFIYVASREKIYYELAMFSCESLKDFHPEAHVTLFTHKSFIDNRINKKLFDNVYTEIPNHYRSKMWCMARSPYQRTLYNDVDTMIEHRDIRKIHSFLEECDMFCGGHLKYTVADPDWQFIDIAKKIPVIYHGSMWGYNKNYLTIDFMQTWFDEYDKQTKSPWPYEEFSQKWRKFDMFTLWKMTSGLYEEFKRFNSLNIKVLSRRWNTTIQDLPEDLDGPRVITQIDKSSWKEIPAAWKIIEKGLNDERGDFKKREIGAPIIRYD